MKWFFALLGIAAIGGIGYVAEPTLRPHLTGASAEPNPVAPKPDTAPPADATPAPAPEPAPEPIPVPEPVPAPDPVPPVTPPPVVDEEPEPAPVAEEEEAPADETTGTDEVADVMEEEVKEEEPAPPAAPADVVSIMQASVRAEQIKEFTFDQVLDWKAGEDETVDGETYQTGLVSYKAETIFGVKNIEAKALIRNGKVERWIWPKSGMEIK